MAANFSSTPLPGVVLVTPKLYHDPRGFFFESFKKSEFIENGLEGNYVQENYSYSKGNVIRGLHFQRHPAAQTKLIRVVNGAIWDVVVDVRPGSASFGKWHSETLTDENCHQLYVPDGFAHGFRVLSDSATVLYRTNAEYAPKLEGGIAWNDPSLAIRWDLANPLISDRDTSLPSLNEALENGELESFTIS